MPTRFIHVSKDLQVLPVRGGGFKCVIAADEDGREIPGVTFNAGRNAAERKRRQGSTARQRKRREKKRPNKRWVEMS